MNCEFSQAHGRPQCVCITGAIFRTLKRRVLRQAAEFPGPRPKLNSSSSARHADLTVAITRLVIPAVPAHPIAPPLRPPQTRPHGHYAQRSIAGFLRMLSWEKPLAMATGGDSRKTFFRSHQPSGFFSGRTAVNGGTPSPITVSLPVYPDASRSQHDSCSFSPDRCCTNFRKDPSWSRRPIVVRTGGTFGTTLAAGRREIESKPAARADAQAACLVQGREPPLLPR